MPKAGTAPATARGRRVKHPVDQLLSPHKLAVYGVQHVLAFYAGAVIVPILLASAIGLSEQQLVHLINADLFTCGIASIIQSVGFWKIGVRLPLLQGVTFTAVSPMIAIGVGAGGGVQGLVVIYGSVIVAGLFTFLIAPYFSRIVRFFPPVVTGTVIAIIGLSLLPVAANDAAGGDASAPDYASGTNLLYAVAVLALIVVIQRLFRGFMATIAVLIGLVAGTLVAWALGDAQFDAVGSSAWVGVTTPFFFGIPKFSFAAIVSMIVVMLITAVETTGDVFATGEIVNKRIGRKDIARALRSDGLSTLIGGILNSFPYTCFAENVGLVRLTGIKSRYVVTTAGVVMILLGIVPKAGAIVAGIPHPVLGGAALAMFGTVAVVGFQTLTRVDFTDYRNVVIVATSVGLALLVTTTPQFADAVPSWAAVIFGSGITLGSLSAILLNLVFHHIGPGRGPVVAGAPGRRQVRLEHVNEMSEDEFVAMFGRLFQGADWVAAGAYTRRPFDDIQSLRRAFQDALFAATSQQQLELMRQYPALGGDDVAEGRTGDESLHDQAAAGLNRLTDEDATEFAELTDAYEGKFGYPLIVCVRDISDAAKVLELGRRRLENSAAQEHATALIEIAKIASRRFDDLVAEANPIHSSRAYSGLDRLP